MFKILGCVDAMMFVCMSIVNDERIRQMHMEKKKRYGDHGITEEKMK